MILSEIIINISGIVVNICRGHWVVLHMTGNLTVRTHSLRFHLIVLISLKYVAVDSVYALSFATTAHNSLYFRRLLQICDMGFSIKS